MKGKIVTYWVVLALTMLSVLYSYTITGVNVSSTKAYLTSMGVPMLFLVLLMLCFLLTTLSSVCVRALTKKNYLRISLFLELILFIVFFAITIRNYTQGWLCLSCIVSTVLMLVLIIISITMLKELYLLIHELLKK